MLHNITIDATIVERVIDFRSITKNPDTGDQLQDLAQMSLTEAITVVEGWHFAVLDRKQVTVLHGGHVAVDTSTADAAYGTYRIGFGAPTMQALRAQIETRVNELIDLVLEQFPYVTVLKPDGSLEREIPEDVQIEGFRMMQQGATPEHRTQVAQVQPDASLIPPHILEQMKNSNAQAIHGQSNQPMGQPQQPDQDAVGAGAPAQGQDNNANQE